MISVIIPVYNVEKYLDQCLKSVTAQTYTDFECILVNDGSTDKSGEICDNWAKNDNRFKVIHQENQGVSAARNKGIENAQGEYIIFIDSDDWVDTDYLETLMGDDSELVISGDFVETQSGCLGTNIPLKNNIINFSKSSIEEIAHLLNKHLFFGPYFKRYKSSIIKKNNVVFPLEVSYGEDLIFNFTYLRYVSQIRTISKATYHYRRFENNTLSTKPRLDYWDLNYHQWLMMKEQFIKKGVFKETAIKIMYNNLWGIIYDSIFNINYTHSTIKRYNYIKNILSIPEVTDLDFKFSSFKTSWWIRLLILNRNYFILTLIFLLKK